jgi:hypothetical protein
METIKQVLMRRDGMTSEEAESLIDEAKQELLNLIDEGDLSAAEDICQEYFGLEPDYLDELMF